LLLLIILCRLNLSLFFGVSVLALGLVVLSNELLRSVFICD